MNPSRVLASILAGIVLSYTVGMQFFAAAGLAPLDVALLFLVPAFAAAFLTYHLLPPLVNQLRGVTEAVRYLLSALALIAAFIITASHFDTFNIPAISAWGSLSLIFLAIVIPSAPHVQNAVGENKFQRIIIGWIIASLLSLVAAGILDNYYNSLASFLLLLIILQGILGLAGYFLAGRVRQFTRRGAVDVFVTLALFSIPVIFAAAIFLHGSQYPQLLDSAVFTMRRGFIPVFAAVSLLCLPWQAWLILGLKARQFFHFKETRLYDFIRGNIPGLLLALAFFMVYLITASMLNHPRFDVDDVFFDADPFNWRLRLTTDTVADYYWRSVHPFILLLFKPPIDFIALFLKGDRVFAAYIFFALGGAACVYLTWRFIRHATHESTYALLVASLLGLTASHLIFGSLLESYIFLALCLILFFVLLMEDRPFPSLVAAGLATIGITHSNFAQNVIALFTVKRDIKLLVRYVATVLVFLVLLTLLNNLLYPNSQPFFFIPSTLQAEQQNLFPLNALRIQALLRGFFFHNVVAPPAIHYTGEIPFIQFRFFKPEIDSLSTYDTFLQNATVWMWIVLLGLAPPTYLFNFKKNRYKSISLALVICILMNVALHLRYGKELFLYTPNWTYAIILSVGLGWQGVARQKLLHIVLLTFLILLAINNTALLNSIIEVLASQI